MGFHESGVESLVEAPCDIFIDPCDSSSSLLEMSESPSELVCPELTLGTVLSRELELKLEN